MKDHFEVASEMTHSQIVGHLEDDHGSPPHEDAPWQWHRIIHSNQVKDGER